MLLAVFCQRSRDLRDKLPFVVISFLFQLIKSNMSLHTSTQKGGNKHE